MGFLTLHNLHPLGYISLGETQSPLKFLLPLGLEDPNSECMHCRCVCKCVCMSTCVSDKEGWENRISLHQIFYGLYTKTMVFCLSIYLSLDQYSGCFSKSHQKPLSILKGNFPQWISVLRPAICISLSNSRHPFSEKIETSKSPKAPRQSGEKVIINIRFLDSINSLPWQNSHC